MKKWTDYDPHTGLYTVDRAQDGDDLVHTTKLQDVEPLVERNKELINSGATDIGIKKGLWHYMSIPLGVQYEILEKYGINVNNRNHWPALFRLVNEHYPYLKTTSKTHVMAGDRGKVYATLKNLPKLAS